VKKSLFELSNEVVRTMVFKKILPPQGSPISIRLEILKDLKRDTYFACLWRLDSYKVRPSFDVSPGIDGCDEYFMVEDKGLIPDISELSADSVEAMVALVLSKIEERFA
jgi:hypothetical protein